MRLRRQCRVQAAVSRAVRDHGIRLRQGCLSHGASPRGAPHQRHRGAQGRSPASGGAPALKGQPQHFVCGQHRGARHHVRRCGRRRCRRLLGQHRLKVGGRLRQKLARARRGRRRRHGGRPAQRYRRSLARYTHKNNVDHIPRRRGGIQRIQSVLRARLGVKLYGKFI